MTQRWAAIEIAAAGDTQEIVGVLLTDVAGCHGFSATTQAVTGYLPVDERLEDALIRLRSALDGAPELFPPGSAEITIRFVAEEDWATAWKQYFKPQRIGKRIVVKPTWEDYAAQPDDLVLQIDPGMAFGTGLHATTRLCLRALEDQISFGSTVADVGTGSGILAVAAALLGAKRIDAVDIDPLAVRIARENVVVNGVGGAVSVAEAASPPPGIFDVIVANILADVILAMAPELAAALKPGGVLIASGIIDRRADDVREGLAKVGLHPFATETEAEWVALLVRR
jgi:ribosomal protein L11 methyltransferase